VCAPDGQPLQSSQVNRRATDRAYGSVHQYVSTCAACAHPSSTLVALTILLNVFVAAGGELVLSKFFAEGFILLVADDMQVTIVIHLGHEEVFEALRWSCFKRIEEQISLLESMVVVEAAVK